MKYTRILITCFEAKLSLIMVSTLTLMAIFNQVVANSTPNSITKSTGNSTGNFSQVIEIPDPGFIKDTRAFVSIGKYMSRQQAERVCVNEYDGRLVKLRTEEEEAAVATFMLENSIPQHFWISLQWERIRIKEKIEGVLLWNDGSCTLNSQRYNFRLSSDSTYNERRPCFLAHYAGNTTLTWENSYCNRATTMCERQTHSWQKMNIAFSAILLPGSNSTICKDLCYHLRNCFMTSLISNACIVGMASSEGNTYVIKEGQNVITDKVNIRYSDVKEISPTNCHADKLKTKIESFLSDYDVLHGPTSVDTVKHTCETITHTVTETVTTEAVTFTEDYGITETTQATQAIPSQFTMSLPIETTQTFHDLSTSMPVLATSVMSSSTVPNFTSTLSIGVSTTATPPTPINKKDLILDKSKLSKTIRSKISATNKEASSKVLGYSMALPFLILFVVVILTDLYTRLLVDVHSRFIVNLQEWLRN